MKRRDYWIYGGLFIVAIIIIVLLVSSGQQNEKKRVELEMNKCLYDVQVAHKGVGTCGAYYDEQGDVHIIRN